MQNRAIQETAWCPSQRSMVFQARQNWPWNPVLQLLDNLFNNIGPHVVYLENQVTVPPGKVGIEMQRRLPSTAPYTPNEWSKVHSEWGKRKKPRLENMFALPWSVFLICTYSHCVALSLVSIAESLGTQMWTLNFSSELNAAICKLSNLIKPYTLRYNFLIYKMGHISYLTICIERSQWGDVYKVLSKVPDT